MSAVASPPGRPAWPQRWARWWLWAALVCGAWLGLASAWAQNGLAPVPALTARVIDQTATLTVAERDALEARLAAYERERGSQVVVVMVPSTAPEDIADYTQRLGDAWKIGRQGVGDGVLLVVAKNDRRLRIATMKAVEGAIPDLVAKRIIDQAIAPHFKQGDYAAGLNAGVTQILARLQGEDWPEPTAPADDDWQDSLALFGFGALFLNLVLRDLVGARLGAVAAALGTGALAGYLTASVWLGVGVGLLTLVLGVVLAALKVAGPGTLRRGHRGGRHDPFGGGGWGSGHGGLGGGGGGFSSGGGGNSGGGGASGGW